MISFHFKNKRLYILKSCKKCGGTAVIMDKSFNVLVICKRCGAFTSCGVNYVGSTYIAVNRWNSR